MKGATANKAELDSSTIDAYAAASERTSPMEPMPDLEASWNAAVRRMRAQVDDTSIDFLFDADALDELLSMIDSIKNSEPRLLARVDFPDCVTNTVEEIVSRIDTELKADPSYSKTEGYDAEADACLSLAKALKRLGGLVIDLQEPIGLLITNLPLHANNCREKYAELSGEGAEDEDSQPTAEAHQSSSEKPFSIESPFVDL